MNVVIVVVDVVFSLSGGCICGYCYYGVCLNPKWDTHTLVSLSYVFLFLPVVAAHWCRQSWSYV